MAMAAFVETWVSVFFPALKQELLEGDREKHLPKCLPHRRTSVTECFLEVYLELHQRC